MSRPSARGAPPTRAVPELADRRATERAPLPNPCHKQKGSTKTSDRQRISPDNGSARPRPSPTTSHLTSEALTPGTHVRITLVAGSTSTARAVTVVLPNLTGTVTSLRSGGLTIRLASGATRSVTTSSATTYTQTGKATTSAALKVGERVRIVAQAPSSTSLSATRVVIEAGG